jgi:flagellar biosynthesis protein FliR
VNAIAPETILSVFAIFCRVGACLIVAPGFSSAQVPTRVRLFIAFAVSLALAPMLIDQVRPILGDGSSPTMLGVLFGELATGLLIGFVTRLLFMALQMMTAAMTQAIGLSAIPGTAIEDHEQAPALTTLFSVTATTLMFVTGLHIELMRGLIDSYAAIPPGAGFLVRPALIDVADKASAAFLAVIRIGSPFIVYSIVVNFAIGFTNKLVPQIPVFFIATPFVMLGGLFLLLLTVHDFLGYFAVALDAWLAGN